MTAVITAKVNALGQVANTASASINGSSAETPQVTSNWARLDITKTDVKNAAPLAGATFELYKADKTTLLATGTTDASGKLSFYAWVGNDTDVTEEVFLKETVAPQGYVLPADPWSSEITLTARRRRRRLRGGKDHHEPVGGGPDAADDRRRRHRGDEHRRAAARRARRRRRDGDSASSSRSALIADALIR